MLTSIQFKQDPKSLYSKLKTEVFSTVFHNKSIYANWKWYLKACVLIALFLIGYGLIPFSSGTNQYLLFSLMGFLSIIIGLNIGHDAVHGSISKKKWVNKAFSFVFDFLGANAYIWKVRHIYGHHPYPNIIHFDSDIQQSPLVRIFPTDTLKPIHQFQHFYIPFLFLLYTSRWLLVRDFDDFTKHHYGNKTIQHPRFELLKLIGFKLLYFGYIVLIPILFWEFTVYQALLSILVMHLSASFMISMALVSAHVGEHQEFPIPDSNGELPYNWLEHQLKTTSDFATQSPIVNFFFGGFNHHIVHHLFQHVNHVHYKEMTRIVKTFCERESLPYLHEASLIKVYFSHLKLLKREGFQQLVTSADI